MRATNCSSHKNVHPGEDHDNRNARSGKLHLTDRAGQDRETQRIQDQNRHPSTNAGSAITSVRNCQFDVVMDVCVSGKVRSTTMTHGAKETKIGRITDRYFPSRD